MARRWQVLADCQAVSTKTGNIATQLLADCQTPRESVSKQQHINKHRTPPHTHTPTQHALHREQLNIKGDDGPVGSSTNINRGSTHHHHGLIGGGGREAVT